MSESARDAAVYTSRRTSSACLACQLWGEYQTSPPSYGDAVLRLVWESDEHSSKQELEDQGLEFRLIGWSQYPVTVVRSGRSQPGTADAASARASKPGGRCSSITWGWSGSTSLRCSISAPGTGICRTSSFPNSGCGSRRRAMRARTGSSCGSGSGRRQISRPRKFSRTTARRRPARCPSNGGAGRCSIRRHGQHRLSRRVDARVDR